jgi:hypothetical protein
MNEKPSPFSIFHFQLIDRNTTNNKKNLPRSFSALKTITITIAVAASVVGARYKSSAPPTRTHSRLDEPALVAWTQTFFSYFERSCTMTHHNQLIEIWPVSQ